MIAEIKNKYKSFHDARIDEIDYCLKSGQSSKELKVSLNCFNLENEVWEDIVIIFKGVTKLVYIDTIKLQSCVVFEALLKQDELGFILDFYPIQVDGREILEEDPNSSFVVHCKDLSFTLK